MSQFTPAESPPSTQNTLAPKITVSITDGRQHTSSPGGPSRTQHNRLVFKTRRHAVRHRLQASEQPGHHQAQFMHKSSNGIQVFYQNADQLAICAALP
ncbi:hypothetical protein WI665_07535 [Vibrio cholerae]